jgi:AraC-like DNA-binding protein
MPAAASRIASGDLLVLERRDGHFPAISSVDPCTLGVRATMPLENLFAHFASASRRVPHVLRVVQVGHLPAKTEGLDWLFVDLAFSLILSGKGTLSVDGGPEMALRAPCVLCCVPYRRYRYGPVGAWEELYFLYPPDAVTVGLAMGLVAKDRHLWPIRSLAGIKRHLDEVAALMHDSHALGHADRMDRVAERILAETLIDTRDVARDTTHGRILAVKTHFETHYAETIDIDGAARRFGFSPSTFRRAWNKYVPETPSKFLSSLRVQQACRLLCETDDPVSKIAEVLGFPDIYYFSRTFKKQVGETARDYRRRYAGGDDASPPRPAFRRVSSR